MNDVSATASDAAMMQTSNDHVIDFKNDVVRYCSASPLFMKILLAARVPANTEVTQNIT